MSISQLPQNVQDHYAQLNEKQKALADAMLLGCSGLKDMVLENKLADIAYRIVNIKLEKSTPTQPPSQQTDPTQTTPKGKTPELKQPEKEPEPQVRKEPEPQDKPSVQRYAKPEDNPVWGNPGGKIQAWKDFEKQNMQPQGSQTPKPPPQKPQKPTPPDPTGSTPQVKQQPPPQTTTSHTGTITDDGVGKDKGSGGAKDKEKTVVQDGSTSTTTPQPKPGGGTGTNAGTNPPITVSPTQTQTFNPTNNFNPTINIPGMQDLAGAMKDLSDAVKGLKPQASPPSVQSNPSGDKPTDTVQGLKMHPHINHTVPGYKKGDVETLQNALNPGGVQRTELTPKEKEANSKLWNHFAKELGIDTSKLTPGQEHTLTEPEIKSFLKKQGLSENQIAQLDFKCSIEIKENGEFNLHVEGNCGEDLKALLQKFSDITKDFKATPPDGDLIKLEIDPNIAILDPNDEDAKDLKNGGVITTMTLPDGTKVKTIVTAEKTKFAITDPGEAKPRVTYEIPTRNVFEQHKSKEGNHLFPNWESAIQGMKVEEKYDRTGFWFRAIAPHSSIEGEKERVNKNMQQLSNALGRYLEVEVSDPTKRVSADIRTGSTPTETTSTEKTPTQPVTPQPKTSPQQSPPPPSTQTQQTSQPLQQSTVVQQPVQSTVAPPIPPPRQRTPEGDKKWLDDIATRLQNETMQADWLRQVKAGYLRVKAGYSRDKAPFSDQQTEQFQNALRTALNKIPFRDRGSLTDLMNGL